MVLHALNYRSLDADQGGTLNQLDLIHTLTKSGLPFHQAYQVSKVVLERIDQSFTGNLNFAEYFSGLENLMSFEELTKYVCPMTDNELQGTDSKYRSIVASVQYPIPYHTTLSHQPLINPLITYHTTLSH